MCHVENLHVVWIIDGFTHGSQQDGWISCQGHNQSARVGTTGGDKQSCGFSRVAVSVWSLLTSEDALRKSCCQNARCRGIEPVPSSLLKSICGWIKCECLAWTLVCLRLFLCGEVDEQAACRGKEGNVNGGVGGWVASGSSTGLYWAHWSLSSELADIIKLLPCWLFFFCGVPEFVCYELQS